VTLLNCGLANRRPVNSAPNPAAFLDCEARIATRSLFDALEQ
jgi:hypothetical protein